MNAINPAPETAIPSALKASAALPMLLMPSAISIAILTFSKACSTISLFSPNKLRVPETAVIPPCIPLNTVLNDSNFETCVFISFRPAIRSLFACSTFAAWATASSLLVLYCFSVSAKIFLASCNACLNLAIFIIASSPSSFNDALTVLSAISFLFKICKLY